MKSRKPHSREAWAVLYLSRSDAFFVGEPFEPMLFPSPEAARRHIPACIRPRCLAVVRVRITEVMPKPRPPH